MEKSFKIECNEKREYTEAQRLFLGSKCFICSKKVSNDQNSRKQHRSAKKMDHSEKTCERCHNHFGPRETATFHTLNVDAMYFAEAIAAEFPEILEKRLRQNQEEA